MQLLFYFHFVKSKLSSGICSFTCTVLVCGRSLRGLQLSSRTRLGCKQAVNWSRLYSGEKGRHHHYFFHFRGNDCFKQGRHFLKKSIQLMNYFDVTIWIFCPRKNILVLGINIWKGSIHHAVHFLFYASLSTKEDFYDVFPLMCLFKESWSSASIFLASLIHRLSKALAS